MDNIKNRLAGIKKRLSKYSLEYNDFSDEDLLYDGEEYEDLSEVMTFQRDSLEDIYCEIDAILEDSSADYKDTLESSFGCVFMTILCIILIVWILTVI